MTVGWLDGWIDGWMDEWIWEIIWTRSSMRQKTFVEDCIKRRRSCVVGGDLSLGDTSFSIVHMCFGPVHLTIIPEKQTFCCVIGEKRC